MPNKQNFELRLTRLIHILDLMSDIDGVRRDVLKDALGIPERTLDRDLNVLEIFFPIQRSTDSDHARRYHFDRWRFDLDEIRKPLTIRQIKDERTIEG